MYLLSLVLWVVLQTEPRLDVHGDPLPPGAAARLGTLRYRRPADSRLLGFTTGGEALVFATRRDIVIMDVATGKATARALATLLDAVTPATNLEYYSRLCGDGTTLLLQSSDHRLFVLDVAQKKAARELAAGNFVPLPAPDESLAAQFDLTHDGATLVAWDHSKPGSYRLRWIDVATGQVHRETPWKKGLPSSYWYQSPRSEFVAVWVRPGEDQEVTCLDVWESASAKFVRRAPQPRELFPLALGADGKTAIQRQWGQGVDCLVYDLESGKELGVFSGSIPFHALSLSPDGKQVFVSTADALEQWDVDGVKRLRRLPHPGVPSGHWTGLTVSASGKRVAMEVGERVTIYDLAEDKALHRDVGHSDTVGALAWSPSGKQLLTVGRDGRALWWDVPSAKTQRAVKAPPVKPVRNRVVVANQPTPSRGPVDMLAGVFPDET